MLLLRAGARRAGAAAAGGRPAHQSPTHLAARPRCAAVAHGRCFSAGRAHGPSPAAAAAAAAPARRGLEPQRRRSPPLDAAEPAAIDTFCWQAARGLASALPPTPTALRGAASATSTSAQAAAAAASLRDIDAWLGANGAGARHGRVGESAAIVEGAEVTVGHVTVGQPPPPPPPGGDGVARELGGDEQGPPAAEGEGMLMSSVLKKRRAKIKKHWCATAPLPLRMRSPPCLRGGVVRFLCCACPLPSRTALVAARRASGSHRCFFFSRFFLTRDSLAARQHCW